jgi:hypothetical protein
VEKANCRFADERDYEGTSCVAFRWLKVIDAILHSEAIRHCGRKCYSTAWLAQTQTSVTTTSVAGTKLDYVFSLCSSYTGFVYDPKVNHNDTPHYYRLQRNCHYLLQRTEHFLQLLMFRTYFVYITECC